MEELHNALVTIKGNALRCGNSIYSIHNIVSLTFESVQKEREEPREIEEGYRIAKIFFKYALFSLAMLCYFYLVDRLPFEYLYSAKRIVFEATGLTIDSEFRNFALFCIYLLLFSCLFLSIVGFIAASRRLTNFDRYYYVHGLQIIFVNNFNLFLVSKSDTGFVKEIIDHLHSFIATADYVGKNELIINFSDSSINIKEAVGSNIIGGNVQGDVKNG